MYALYKRRMFRMQLVVSRSILFVLLAIICIVMSLYLIVPFQNFLVSELELGAGIATGLAAIFFGIILIIAYGLLRKVADSVFTKDEQQGREVQNFATQISQTLSTNEIMEMLSAAILHEIVVDKVFVCLKEGNKYVSKFCSSPLAVNEFTIDESSPQISYLKNQENYIVLREFESNPMFLSTWESEKQLFRDLQIGVIAALKDGDDVIGLVLVSSEDEDREYKYNETSYLETICTVTSIAMKNARLYEQMFREARVDSLTGAYNFRYFIDKTNEVFEECKGSSLALMYADVDDFRLYNQLYGTEAGDDILKRIAQAIGQCLGETGMVFRTAGKVFAILLPNQDVRYACTVAEEIRRRVKAINQAPGRTQMKEVSMSVGICVAPYAATTARELMDNADLATYYAKMEGKDTVNVFKQSTNTEPKKISERTDKILGEVDHGDTQTFAMISALTAAIDAKDHYTYFHSKNVARYASCLAVAAGLNDEQVRTIYLAGLLHDIGKISIPEIVLNKSGKLTDEEYGLMKDHVNNSIEMIRHLPGMDYLTPAVLGHHERFDERGYPRGIAGEEIPITARCLAVADVFDAMTTDRPYRKGLPLDYAISQLVDCAGTQFDPELAKIFVKLLEDKEIIPNTRAQESIKKDRLY